MFVQNQKKETASVQQLTRFTPIRFTEFAIHGINTANAFLFST